MRTVRFAPVLAAGALLVGGVAPAAAQTDEPVAGVGTTTNQLSVLSIDAGGLLDVDLLSDFAQTNINPSAGDTRAVAVLSPLAVSSPAVGVSQELATMEAHSTGDPAQGGGENIEVDTPVLSATVVPGTMSALVDSAGAVSGLAAGVLDLNVLGGLVAVDQAAVFLGSEALTANSAGEHVVEVRGVTLLDLEALLAGLGLPITSLPLDTVLDLINSLGLLDELGAELEAAGLPIDLGDLSVEAIASAINDLGADVGALSELATDLTAETPVCDTAEPVFDLLGNLIGEEPATLCDDIVETVADTTEQVVDLSGILGDVLTAPLAVLAGQPLLSLDSVRFGLDTLATESVETSSAGVATHIGEITIGSLALPALGDLPTVEAVTATTDQAQGAVGSILASINPALGDLVSVSALDSNSSVSENAGVVSAVADLTGLRVSVNPDLSVILDLIEGFASVPSIGDELADLGVDLPVGPVEITDFNSLLAGTPTAGLFENDLVYALSEGLTIEVASATQSSVFSAEATPVVPQLPFTGSSSTQTLILAAGAALLAITVRRLSARVQ